VLLLALGQLGLVLGETVPLGVPPSELVQWSLLLVPPSEVVQSSALLGPPSEVVEPCLVGVG
jgi:hypothetical protein